MTLEQFIQEATAEVQRIQTQEAKALRIASADTNSKQWVRIFEKGMAADGTEIGQYKDGHYRAKRARRGLPVNRVNLLFTGAMQKDFARPPMDQGGTFKKTLRPANNDKMVGNEDYRKKEIMALSDDEVENFERVFRVEFEKS